MDYEFFSGFTPRIVEVSNRRSPLWEMSDHRIAREKTGVHSLGYVYGGEGVLQFAGATRTLAPGDLFQIWPGETMALTSSRSHPLAFYSFLFQYRIVYWEGIEMRVREAEGKLPIQLVHAGADMPAVEAAFRKAHELWSEKHNGYEWEVKLQFLQTIQLLHKVGAGQNADSSGKYAVQKAIEQMKEDYTQPLSRDRLAESVSLSPGYFSVLFKEHTGISPIRYLNKIRVDQAKQLLQNSVLPIKEIAEQCGFEDSFYFSRLFQKETGMSPRNYRKSI